MLIIGSSIKASVVVFNLNRLDGAVHLLGLGMRGLNEVCENLMKIFRSSI